MAGWSNSSDMKVVGPQRKLAVLSQPVLLGIGFAILVMIALASGWLMTTYRADAQAIAAALDDQKAVSALLLQIRRADDIAGFSPAKAGKTPGSRH